MKIIERIKSFFSKKADTKPSLSEALKNSFGTPAQEPVVTEVGTTPEGKHYQATTRHVWVDGKWTALNTQMMEDFSKMTVNDIENQDNL